MGAAAPIAAAASPLAAMGLSAMSTIDKGKAEQAAQDFKADRAEQAAKFGRLQGELTGTTLTEQLNTTLANIDAIRAGGNVDPASPTGAAITDLNAERSDRQRMAALVSSRSQADSDEAGAAYLRKAGDFALSQSYLQAGIGVSSAASKMFTGGGSFSLGS